MSNVILINCFEVPAGRDDEFVSAWKEVNRYMRSKPGYIRHRLHQSLSGDARYRYVNVAEWESLAWFDAAHDDGFRRLVGQPRWREFPATPTLFQAVDENNV